MEDLYFLFPVKAKTLSTLLLPVTSFKFSDITGGFM
jgi:hypothetical protein